MIEKYRPPTGKLFQVINNHCHLAFRTTHENFTVLDTKFNGNFFAREKKQQYIYSKLKWKLNCGFLVDIGVVICKIKLFNKNFTKVQL